jgi:hypothetical protein
LHAESFKYLARHDQVLLADSIRQRGFDHEYKTAGKGTPIVVFTKNPENTAEDKHYPAIGIALGITAVKEERQGRVPVLKLYDSFDPVVVRCALRYRSGSDRRQLHGHFSGTDWNVFVTKPLNSL